MFVLHNSAQEDAREARLKRLAERAAITIEEARTAVDAVLDEVKYVEGITTDRRHGHIKRIPDRRNLNE